MKMARASEKDLAAAQAVSQILGDLERGYMPDVAEDEESERFDIDDAAQCQRVLRLMLDAIGEASIFRVTFGMLVVCDPRNKLLDPEADTLEIHPEHEQNALAAAQYRWLRDLDCNSLSLSRNDGHAPSYMTAAEYIDSYPDFFNDVPADELVAMRATNTIWSLQVYPNTPVGFNVWHGATAEAAVNAAMAAEREE